MAKRLILPFADVGSGIKPASGAQLFFSDSGLTFDASPKDTFSNLAGNINNANPVIADANGLFPEIYIDGNYRVVLKDKNNVQQWQADNVTEEIDSTDVSFTNSGTGALQTTVEAWLQRRTAGAYDFGDIDTDIGAAINAAISAGKKVIHLPQGGPYLIATEVVIPPNTNLVAAGRNATHLRISVAGIIGIRTNGNHSSVSGFLIDTAPSLVHTTNIVQNGSLSVAAERCLWNDLFIDGQHKKSIGNGHNFEIVFGNLGHISNVASVDSADRGVSFSSATTDVVAWSFSGFNDFRGATNEPFLMEYTDANDPRSFSGGLITCQASGGPCVINSRNNHLSIYAEGLDTNSSATISVVSNGGIDYTCIAPHTSTQVISKVVGTDGNDYVCIREHVAEAANQPITGSDHAKYWIVSGSGSGSAWVADTTYTTSNEPGVGGGWRNKWRITGSTGATAWANATAYTAGQRQMVLGDSAEGNKITMVNGNRVIDTSKEQENLIYDKDISGNKMGVRSPLRVDGKDGFFEITNAAGGMPGGLKLYHDAALSYRFAGIDTGSTQTIEFINEVGGDLNVIMDNLTADTVTVTDAGPLRTLTGLVTDLADTASETILTEAQLGTTSSWIVAITTDGVTSDRAMSIVFGKTPTLDATSLVSNNITLTAAGTGDLQMTNNTGNIESFNWTAMQFIA